MNTPIATPAEKPDREIWAVLSLIVLSNVAMVLAVSEGWVRAGIYIFGRFFLLAAVLAFGVFLFRGWKAPFALLKPMLVWRINPLWILFAISWPQVLGAMVVLGKGLLLGTGLAEFDKVTLDVAFHKHIFPNIVISAFVGEIVWVGYAIGRLRNQMTTAVAAMVVGLFWASWWAPVVIYGVGVIPGIPLPGLYLSQTAVAVMCGFIYAQTRSGWVVLSLQISANCSFLIFPVAPESGGLPTYLAHGLIYFCASLSLYAIFGPRPLFRFQKPGPADPAQATA